MATQATFLRSASLAIRASLALFIASALVAPDAVRAFEGPYSREGVYGVFVAVPPPGWKSPYELSEGVPLVYYPGLGSHHNPVTTAQYGLARWSTGLKYGAPEEIATAEHVGLWLVEHQHANGEWLYDFPDIQGPGSELTLEPPWASALAQGQAISLLTRLYRHTKEQVYLTAAKSALQPLLKPVVEGGLASRYEGTIWLEEYPTTKPIYTLNGFLMTIVGVYDLADLDPAAQTLFEETVATAVKALPAFDTGQGSSWYDLVGRYGGEQHIAPPGYGPVIRNTLELLNTLSPHEALLRYAHTWINEGPLIAPLHPAPQPPPNPPASSVSPAPEYKSPAVPDAELASRALVASATGHVKMQITCPATEVSCGGSVTLETLGKARQKPLVLAVAWFAAAGAHVTTATLQLSAKARRLLAHARVMRVRATIVAHDLVGASHTSKTIVTLRLGRSGYRGRRA
jgi:hypothetical protein